MDISEIGSRQINLLKKSQNFLTLQKKEKFNVAGNPSCYLSSWSREYGNLVLKSLNDKIDNTSKIYFNLKKDIIISLLTIILFLLSLLERRHF